MVVDMYIIGPKKDRFKPVFFGLFDFSKMKKPRPRLQKTNKRSFLVLVLFGLSPVQLESFASPRTGLSNTTPCHLMCHQQADHQACAPVFFPLSLLAFPTHRLRAKVNGFALSSMKTYHK